MFIQCWFLLKLLNVPNYCSFYEHMLLYELYRLFCVLSFVFKNIFDLIQVNYLFLESFRLFIYFYFFIDSFIKIEYCQKFVKTFIKVHTKVIRCKIRFYIKKLLYTKITNFLQVFYYYHKQMNDLLNFDDKSIIIFTYYLLKHKPV